MSEKVVPLRELGSWKEAGGLADRLRIELGVLSNVYADDLAGYVVVCVNSEGGWSVVWKCDKDTPIGCTMLAGIAIGGIQRDMIADRAATEAIVRNGLRDPAPEDAS